MAEGWNPWNLWVAEYVRPSDNIFHFLEKPEHRRQPVPSQNWIFPRRSTNQRLTGRHVTEELKIETSMALLQQQMATQ